jgi:hypothetical protein
VRKIRATGREGAGTLLGDALRVMAVLDLKLADHEGHREAIRTIQLALVEKHALEGEYASPYRTGGDRLRHDRTQVCTMKPVGARHHPM